MNETFDQDDLCYLEQRLGRVHSRQRLGIEKEHEAQVFGQGLNYFHIENSKLAKWVISSALKLSGMYWWGQKNAAQVVVRENKVHSNELPDTFSSFKILQLSDLHIDISQAAVKRVSELIKSLTYDICVLTGDYRGQTFGPIDNALAGLSDLVDVVETPIYGVLGNHDSIRMLPGMERLGIRVLLNETETLLRDGEKIHIAGIDDAHFYRADNIEKVAHAIPHNEFSILLSHTPEIYRQAAHADFSLMLSGHTHGGQICLPGGFPITLDSDLPRRFGAGPWVHHRMQGYTSVGAGTSIVPVRFNCSPEITLHYLEKQ